MGYHQGQRLSICSSVWASPLLAPAGMAQEGAARAKGSVPPDEEAAGGAAEAAGFDISAAGCWVSGLVVFGFVFTYK